MALFKLRKSRDDVSGGVPPESIEAMRARARHRLIGAAVLVLVAVIGFPLLFDTQPRPVPVDIAIEIPDRNKVKPLVMPAPAGSSAAAPAASSARAAVLPAASAPEPVTKVASAPISEAKPAAQRASAGSAAIKSAASAASATAAARTEDGAKARALLEGKPADVASADGGRFIVQVGAFADDAKVREVRQKLEKAGMKTIAQVVDTPEGKRTRVRLGPFSSREEAEKVAERAKALELPGNILKL